MSKKGYFISFEGTDGCGKTTQLKNVENYLRDKGFDILILREPGGTKIGEKVREIILDTNNSEMDDMAEMLLYAASRAQLMGQVVLPAIEEGKIVICDRFVDSSLVYQGVARGLGIENVYSVNLNATRGILPDKTFFINVNPEISLNRRINDSVVDRLEMEGIGFQKKVYNAYLEIAEKFKERITIIDGTGTIDEVFADIRNSIDDLLGG